MKLRRKIKMLGNFARLFEGMAKARGQSSYIATNTRRRITILRSARRQGIHI
ncbi:MAG: hypothetical protein M0Q93_00395 [Terrimicrobiaceae bacterium]|nr:hypothetical protein [Terrimicrobiaceae bacterium]